MNTIVRDEIEKLILSGRRKSVEEFDLILDQYLQNKTDKDKSEIGEALADFYNDRIHQYINIENELAILKQ